MKQYNLNALLFSLLFMSHGLSAPTFKMGRQQEKFNYLVPTSFHNDSGLGEVVVLGAAVIGVVIVFILALVLGAQFAGISTIYGNIPATNITKITTNIANGVVTGSSFVTLIYLLAAIALLFVVFGLAIRAMKKMGGGRE